MSRFTPSFSSVFFIFTGSVPAEEQVVNAITMASAMPRKNRTGLICPTTAATEEYTQTAWIVQPTAIAIITESSGRRTFGPFCTTTGKRRQKTPIGARRIIMAIIL